jgi:hypothetical protein
MKPWPVLLALGVIALATGAVMVLLQYHHTVGLGAVGLGVLLLAAGAGMAYLDRKTVKVTDQKVAVPTKRQGSLRKALIAVLVVVVIGVGTFYGASYLGSVQPGNSFSSITNILTTSTQIGTTTTYSSTPIPILPIFNLTSYNVTTGGSNNVTLTASYNNTGSTSVPVNFFLVVTFANGTFYTPGGYLYFPAGNMSHVIQPKGQYSVDVNQGTFLSDGNYIMTFYVINATSAQTSAGSIQQISETSNVPFTITAPTN